MKIRALLISVALAVVGATLLLLYMRQFEAEASGGPRIDLLVAARAIQRGEPVTAEVLGVRSVPQAYVDDRAIRAVDRDKILNLKAMTNVPVQQTLVWTDLIAASDERRDLSSLVQPGNRAMPIRVQFDEALQLIRPGDFIDLLLVDGVGVTSSVLLQRVLVLAIGLDTAARRSDDAVSALRASILTVSVNLQEAQLLGLAQSAGQLMAVVRNSSDPRVLDAPPDVGRDELFDTNARQAVQRSRQRPVRLEREIQ